MTVRAPEQATRGGIPGTYYAATALDSVPPGVLLHVKNANAAACIPTFVTPGVVDVDVPIGDPACNSIPATIGMAFIRVPTDRAYVDPADGLVDITWSVTPSVTFAVIS